jgi:3-oxoacyl-[acyl-carrier protein] reductase
MKNTILITGATSGIGRFLADKLTLEGNKVIGVGRNIDGQENFEVSVCDISDYNQILSLTKELEKKSIKPEVLINCAGVASLNLFLMTPKEVIEKIYKTNVFGTIYLTQLMARNMIPNKFGRIINFSSIAAKQLIMGESIYASSKSAIENLTKGVARELAPFGITVNCISPGPIDTKLIKNVSSEQIENVLKFQINQKMQKKSDILEIVRWLISPESKSITGQIINVGGA